MVHPNPRTTAPAGASRRTVLAVMGVLGASLATVPLLDRKSVV